MSLLYKVLYVALAVPIVLFFYPHHPVVQLQSLRRPPLQTVLYFRQGNIVILILHEVSDTLSHGRCGQSTTTQLSKWLILRFYVETVIEWNIFGAECEQVGWVTSLEQSHEIVFWNLHNFCIVGNAVSEECFR